MFEVGNKNVEQPDSSDSEKPQLLYQSIRSTSVTLTDQLTQDDSFAYVRISVKKERQSPWTPAAVVCVTQRGDIVVQRFPDVPLDGFVAIHIANAKKCLREFWEENSTGKYLALLNEDDEIDAIWFVSNYDEKFEDAYADAIEFWRESDDEFFEFMGERLRSQGYVIEDVPFEECES